MTDEIEYLTDEQLASIVDESSNLYYVYFNEAGKIDAITNEKRETTTLSFIRVEYQRIEKFLLGKEHFSDYTVSLVDKDTPVILKKTEDAGVNTNWLLKIKSPSTSDTTLHVVWDSVSKSWKFSINESLKNQIKSLGLNAQLLFFVTLTSNPNYLIRTIRIDMLDILNSKELEFPWVSTVEQDYYSISVSTRRFFESYGILKHE